jgi:hypothetical protein
MGYKIILPPYQIFSLENLVIFAPLLKAAVYQPVKT